MLLQNFLNTWCDHEIADSAQPRYRSIVTRPFSLLVRAGSGHETSLFLACACVAHVQTVVTSYIARLDFAQVGGNS